MMKFRYFFDPGAGVCLWAADPEARERYGYGIDFKELPLNSDTRMDGARLLAWFDRSIDWSNPRGETVWGEEEQQQFRAESQRFLVTLKSELGSNVEIIDEADV